LALRCSDTDPLWRAVLQIIEEELREVRIAATTSVREHGVVASWVGGMEALERLRTSRSRTGLGRKKEIAVSPLLPVSAQSYPFLG
jgi:hypothetical protein